MSRQRLRESNIKWTMSLTTESQAFKVLKLAEIKCLENKSKEIFETKKLKDCSDKEYKSRLRSAKSPIELLLIYNELND